MGPIQYGRAETREAYEHRRRVEVFMYSSNRVSEAIVLNAS